MNFVDLNEFKLNIFCWINKNFFLEEDWKVKEKTMLWPFILLCVPLVFRSFFFLSSVFSLALTLCPSIQHVCILFGIDAYVFFGWCVVASARERHTTLWLLWVCICTFVQLYICSCLMQAHKHYFNGLLSYTRVFRYQSIRLTHVSGIRYPELLNHDSCVINVFVGFFGYPIRIKNGKNLFKLKTDKMNPMLNSSKNYWFVFWIFFVS